MAIEQRVPQSANGQKIGIDEKYRARKKKTWESERATPTTGDEKQQNKIQTKEKQRKEEKMKSKTERRRRRT